MIGELLGAEETLARVIHRIPFHGPAHLMRSGLRIQTESTNHVSALQVALRQPAGPVENRIALHFALAKELEDLRRFDEAFSTLEVGCRLQRKRMQYDVAQDIAVIDRIIRVHTKTIVEGTLGFRTEEPIFVVGLPRSGTTLVAQILASHSAVHSIGETPALAAETIDAVRRRVGRRVGKTEFVTQVLEVDPSILGKSYLEATRPQTGHTFRLLVVQYEDLIRDQATVTRRLLKHCGLDWEDACLKFSEQGNAVMTASAAQIRQDLYSSSVGNSRHYGRRLDFLRSTLERQQLLGSRLAPA